jgi:adenylylsulfate kinase
VGIGNVRSLLDRKKYLVEVFVDCSLEECERRDAKGLYKKAREGSVQQFTGISAHYENPESTELCVITEKESIEQSAQKVLDYLLEE